MSQDKNYLNYCEVASKNSPRAHEIVTENQNESCCKFCGKTESDLKNTYNEHQEGLHREAKGKGYEPGLQH